VAPPLCQILGSTVGFRSRHRSLWSCSIGQTAFQMMLPAMFFYLASFYYKFTFISFPLLIDSINLFFEFSFEIIKEAVFVCPPHFRLLPLFGHPSVHLPKYFLDVF
jgi:hypothetical protein